jgi:hypothetical protein
MNRPGHETATMFTGIEVERSLMYGQKTLFVIGIQPMGNILNQAYATGCPHIYLGANATFEPTEEWGKFVMSLVEQNIEVTLDFDVSHWGWVCELGAMEYNNFHPMVSVKMPYVGQASYNTTVKLDDADFEKSNPGVWCHSLHRLTAPENFTPWKSYKSDQVVETKKED